MNKRIVLFLVGTLILIVTAGIILTRSTNKVALPPPAVTTTEQPKNEPPSQNDEYQEGTVKPPGVQPSPGPKPPSNPVTPPPPTPQPTPSEISIGNTSRRQVIFTFDAGAGTQSLSPILATLQRHNVKGTFFITGKWAETNRSGVQSITNAGHEIFNHTYSHPNLTTISETAITSEIQQAENIIKGITNKSTKPYFRPPYGARNKYVLDVTWSQGYRSVYWTIDALDWQEGATASQVKQRVLNNVNPGTIYLMHIGDNITGEVLDYLFTTIKDRGYTIVPLSEGL